MKFQPILFGLMVSCGIATAQTPLLHYTFDEASGNALDYGSGIAANATFESGATRSSNTPAIGNTSSLSMSAAGQHLAGPDADKLDGLSQFTLITWINLQASPVNHRLMSKQAAGSFDGFSLHILNPSSGTISASNFGLHMFIGGENGFAHDNVAGVGGNLDADNKWLFVAVSYDGTSAANNVNYYFGNAETGVALSHTTTINAGTVNASTARFMVGRTDAAPDATTVNIIGFQDDVRVYGSALDLNDLEEIRLQAIPEPSTYALIGTGLAALFGIRRMRKS